MPPRPPGPASAIFKLIATLLLVGAIGAYLWELGPVKGSSQIGWNRTSNILMYVPMFLGFLIWLIWSKPKSDD